VREQEQERESESKSEGVGESGSESESESKSKGESESGVSQGSSCVPLVLATRKKVLLGSVGITRPRLSLAL